MTLTPNISSGTLEELADSCVAFYKMNRDKMSTDTVHKKRAQLSRHVETFHRDCGTLTAPVQRRIQELRDGNCIVLMIAHQPNFFGYSGVFRKATLNFVLSDILEKRLKLPVVCFFGIADQDFTDDRWVRSALLPDVQRRDGLFSLSVSLPRKLLLNSVPKLSQEVFNGWRSAIDEWFSSKLASLRRLSRASGLGALPEGDRLKENFEGFWKIAEDAYTKAVNYSDFNAFLISRIINHVWGYDTLFSRFSECEQIFEPEFCYLLSRFDEYSKYVKDVTTAQEDSDGGVSKFEHSLLPFWYHCDCGSKARLIMHRDNESLFGVGECLSCGKEYRLNVGTKNDPEISGLLPRISARSLSMPLVFFEGLRITCYVSGIGGREYLRQTKHVAEKMGLTFPPTVIWRPKDVYLGIGQLEAIMMYRRISETFDFSKFHEVKKALEKKIAISKERIDEIKLQKQEVARSAISCEEKVGKERALSFIENQIMKGSGFASLIRDSRLLENVMAVQTLHPSILDYAINIGLEKTNEQWTTFLKENGNLESDVYLGTVLSDSFRFLDPKLAGTNKAPDSSRW
jgi:hypothetical protein